MLLRTSFFSFCITVFFFKLAKQRGNHVPNAQTDVGDWEERMQGSVCFFVCSTVFCGVFYLGLIVATDCRYLFLTECKGNKHESHLSFSSPLSNIKWLTPYFFLILSCNSGSSHHISNSHCWMLIERLGRDRCLGLSVQVLLLVG